MAIPVDAGRATTDGSTSTTSQTLNLPGSIAAGDLLVAYIRSPIATTYSWPAGWEEIFQSSPDAVDDWQGFAFKIADGTEGASVTVTLGTAARMSGIVWRFTGTAPLAVEFIPGAIGVSANPNAPNSVLTGGIAHDVLWLTSASGSGARTITTPPSGYSNATISSHTGGDGGNTSCWVAGATLGSAADTAEDAGAWTISASSTWTAHTFAVYTADPQLRVSQDPVEVAVLPTDAALRVSQDAVEVIVLPFDSPIRITQAVVEIAVETVQTLPGFRAYIID